MELASFPSGPRNAVSIKYNPTCCDTCKRKRLDSGEQVRERRFRTHAPISYLQGLASQLETDQIEDYLLARLKGDGESQSVQGLAKSSSVESWEKRGQDYKAKKLWNPAALCFNNSGNQRDFNFVTGMIHYSQADQLRISKSEKTLSPHVPASYKAFSRML
jgi:hypothetical protein